MELILQNLKKNNKINENPIYNSFLDTDEKTALSARELHHEEFDYYGYMANNRKNN